MIVHFIIRLISAMIYFRIIYFFRYFTQLLNFKSLSMFVIKIMSDKLNEVLNIHGKYKWMQIFTIIQLSSAFWHKVSENWFFCPRWCDNHYLPRILVLSRGPFGGEGRGFQPQSNPQLQICWGRNRALNSFPKPTSTWLTMLNWII